MSNFTGLIKISSLNKPKFSSCYSPIQTFKEKKSSEYFSASFWDSHLLTKKGIFSELARKCFKTTKKHSLTVGYSLWGEKRFLLIFVSFYWVDQKKLFKQIQIYLRICSFSNLIRKTNFQSISVHLSEIVFFID